MAVEDRFFWSMMKTTTARVHALCVHACAQISHPLALLQFADIQASLFSVSYPYCQGLYSVTIVFLFL